MRALNTETRVKWRLPELGKFYTALDRLWRLRGGRPGRGCGETGGVLGNCSSGHGWHLLSTAVRVSLVSTCNQLLTIFCYLAIHPLEEGWISHSLGTLNCPNIRRHQDQQGELCATTAGPEESGSCEISLEKRWLEARHRKVSGKDSCAPRAGWWGGTGSCCWWRGPVLESCPGRWGGVTVQREVRGPAIFPV